MNNNIINPIQARHARLQSWLTQQFSQFDPVNDPIEPIKVGNRFADPGQFHYFRITVAGDTHIVIDLFGETEKTLDNGTAFIKVAALLATAGLNVPKIVTQDLEQGFLLLSNIGPQSYLDTLTEENADSLLRPAADALIKWQLSSMPNILPDVSAAQLRRELNFFSDGYLAQHLALALNDAQKKTLDNVFNSIVAANLTEGKVFVHRDYVPQNLLLANPNPGVLGFERAIYGPVSYDIASLYKDAFISWDEERVLDGTIRYWEKAKKAGLPVSADFGDFYRDVEWMGLQRHLHLLGAFASRGSAGGEPNYLAEAPRFLKYIRKVGERYTALFPMIRLFDALKIDDGITRKVGYTF